jgi:hypothetical protein
MVSGTPVTVEVTLPAAAGLIRRIGDCASSTTYGRETERYCSQIFSLRANLERVVIVACAGCKCTSGIFMKATGTPIPVDNLLISAAQSNDSRRRQCSFRHGRRPSSWPAPFIMAGPDPAIHVFFACALSAIDESTDWTLGIARSSAWLAAPWHATRPGLVTAKHGMSRFMNLDLRIAQIVSSVSDKLPELALPASRQ